MVLLVYREFLATGAAKKMIPAGGGGGICFVTTIPKLCDRRTKLKKTKEALYEILENYTGETAVQFHVAVKFRIKKHALLQRQLSKGNQKDFFKLH